MNENKYFLINRGELLERWDPIFNLFILKPEHTFKFPTVKLRKLLLRAPQYGANEQGIERKSDKEPRYIRITDIDEFGRLLNELGVTAKRIEKQYLLKNNDLLIARSGNTVGKSYLHKADAVNYDSFYAGYMIRFLINENQVSPDYVFYYTQLDYYKKWVKAIQRPTGQPNINAEEYKSLQIPLPSITTQKLFVEGLKKAYQVCLDKENKSEALLKEIDQYLLKELGVILPKKVESTIENRLFKTNREKLTGNRFDPSYYTINWELKSSKYKTRRLPELVFIDPKTNTRHLKSKDEVSFVPMECISETGEIETSQTRLFSESKGYTVFQEGDLLWAKITPCMENGKSAIAHNLVKAVGFGSTEYFVFRAKTDKINLSFLYFLLHTEYIRNEAKKTFGGSAGHQRVSKDFFQKMLLPIPDLNTQTKIAEKLTMKKLEAFRLKEEAIKGFELAKKEIEKLILE